VRRRGSPVFVSPEEGRQSFSYFSFFFFSALNLAHLAFVAFEILARAAADIVLFRVRVLGAPTEPECEPLNADIATLIPLS
jgi:hypothetical protein